MSLARLEELMSNSQWEESSVLAKEMLERRPDSPDAAVQLFTLACKINNTLKDHLAAVSLGEQAVEIAWEQGLWDRLAHALYHLAVAYYNVRRYQDQLDLHFKYLDLRKRFSEQGSNLEGKVWHMMGLAYHNGLHELQKAKSAFKLARGFYQRVHDVRNLDRVTHDLTHTLLGLGELDEVEPLLAESEAYARSRPDDALAQFDHAYDTCKYLQTAGKYLESVKVGLQALEHAKGHPIWEYCVYIELYRSALAVKDYSYALGFALSARLSAIDGRRYELEYEATATMIELIRERGPGVVEELDAQYRQHGMDLFQYIPESLLRRARKEED